MTCDGNMANDGPSTLQHLNSTDACHAVHNWHVGVHQDDREGLARLRLTLPDVRLLQERESFPAVIRCIDNMSVSP